MLALSKVLSCDSFLQSGSQLPNLSAGFFLAVRLPRFVMRQDVALRLLIQHGNIVLSEVDDAHPVTGRVRYFRFCG